MDVCQSWLAAIAAIAAKVSAMIISFEPEGAGPWIKPSYCRFVPLQMRGGSSSSHTLSALLRLIILYSSHC